MEGRKTSRKTSQLENEEKEEEGEEYEKIKETTTEEDKNFKQIISSQTRKTVSQAKWRWGASKKFFLTPNNRKNHFGGNKIKIIVEYFEKLPKTKTTENTFIVGEHKHKEYKTQEKIEANERENMIWYDTRKNQ